MIKIIDDNGEIEMHLFNNKVLFKYKNILFQSRLLSGTYPTNSSVIPSNFEIQIDVDVNVLYEMIDRASLLTHAGRNNVVNLNLDTENGKVKLTGTSAEIGNVEEDVNFKNLDGKNLTISFNPDYLRDALRASVTDAIVMKFTQPLRPFTVTPNKDDVQFIQLITPVRTF